jgi:hypothetical protein
MRKRHPKPDHIVAIVLAMTMPALGGAQEAQPATVEAVTATGEKVLLLPNGRWEFTDPKKAEPQRARQNAADERERAAQGGLFGLGRKIYPGDPDYNRGTLNPSRR